MTNSPLTRRVSDVLPLSSEILQALFSPAGRLFVLATHSESVKLRVSAQISTGAEPLNFSTDLTLKAGDLLTVLGAGVLCGAELVVPHSDASQLREQLDEALSHKPRTIHLPHDALAQLEPPATTLLAAIRGALEELSDDDDQLLLLRFEQPPWPPSPRQRSQPFLRSRSVAAQEARDEHLWIPSPGHYAALQQALSLNTFGRSDGSRFPRAALAKGGASGYAELRPITPEEELLMSPEEADALARRMWEQREELSDRDADTLDAISAVWIGKARSASDRAGVFIDDLLRLRGLRPKKGGQGRRGGFEPEQRADLWRCLLHLQELWLDIAEATVVEEDERGKRRRRTRSLQSRAFVMTDRIGQRRLDGSMDVEAILVTPGEAFGRFLLGPGRQVALLSSAALQYDPLRQRYEKRLARFLSWQWRVGAHKGDFLRTYRVATLVEEVDLNTDRPSSGKKRLEKALDRLHQDGVIAGWQYQGWDEERYPRQGWLSFWLEARLVIEAPDLIKESYRRLDRLQEPQAVEVAPESWAQRLKQVRKRRGLTQMMAAEELGISRAYIAQIERGRSPSKALQAQLREWFQGG